MGIFDELLSGGARNKRRDILQANEAAQRAREAGLARFGDTSREGLRLSTEPLREGGELGLSGLRRFAAGVGALGPGAQQGFIDDLPNDPGFLAEQANAERALLRGQNAAGSLASGPTFEALARQGLLARRGFANNQLAQLLQLAGLGQTDRTNVANLTRETFRDIGSAQLGTAQQDAAALRDQGRDFAATRGTSINNLATLLAAAGTAASGFRPRPKA